MARDKVERVRRGELFREGPRRQRQFCVIPTTLLATQRIRSLSGQAVRVLLWLEGHWHPNRGAALPQREVAGFLRLNRRAVSRAIKELLAAELITLKTAAIAPSRMGSGTGRGRAAVYDVVHRRQKGAMRFDQGDPRLQGFAKFWHDDLVMLAEQLTNRAARAVLIVLAVDRQSDGRLQNDAAAIDMSGERLARDLPGMNERTGRRAVADLLTLGLVKEVRAHTGRRGARYEPAGVLLTCIPRRRSNTRPASSNPRPIAARPDGSVDNALEKSGKLAFEPGKLPDSR